jgi:trans-L-3-hydroxyproline dehydratase
MAPPVHSRNVCIFAEGEVDRSPTGTGVSGRAAILHARGALAVGDTITIESLIGTRFDVRVVETTRVGDRPR